jgi:amidase
VERLRRAGVIAIGKTNVSEFGMGSHTYNEVYGTTLNPYDLRKTAGGSSGGAGAALAAGLLPLASGSDLGGSLRNPANFNNIVALRPTVGLVPSAPSGIAVFGVQRQRADGAIRRRRRFSAERDGGRRSARSCCVSFDPHVFAEPLERELKNVRLAWSLDLGGLPLDNRVRSILEAQRKTFSDLGCIVEDACPDLAGADEIFLTIRAWSYWHTLGRFSKSIDSR